MKKIVALFTLLAVLDRLRRQRRRPALGETTSPRRSRTRTTRPVRRSAPPVSTTTPSTASPRRFHDSDLSDEALQAIVDGDEDFTGSKDDQDIASDEDFQADIAKCVTG